MKIQEHSSRPCRVVLVDDHPVFRAGLRAVLARAPDLQVIADTGDRGGAMQLVCELRPEIALVGAHLPGIGGAMLISKLRELVPTCRAIGLSATDDPLQAAEMFRAGAVGLVLKTQPVTAVAEAIGCVRAGLRYVPPTISRVHLDELLARRPPLEILTRREREVLTGLVEGMSSSRVARQLSISVRTAETHRRHIMQKLGVHSILELAALASRCGLGRGA